MEEKKTSMGSTAVELKPLSVFFCAPRISTLQAGRRAKGARPEKLLAEVNRKILSGNANVTALSTLL